MVLLREGFVQTFKRAMKAGEKFGGSLKRRLSRFLLDYRSTPHATTNVSPSELFVRRKIQTQFDLLKPDVESFITSKQSQQKKYHDSHSKLRNFTLGSTGDGKSLHILILTNSHIRALNYSQDQNHLPMFPLDVILIGIVIP